MREDLLGYLLNALDDAERARVEEALRRSPELQRQLEELKEKLLPIDEGQPEFEPPPGLADRTCDVVEEAADMPVELFQSRAARGNSERPTRYWTFRGGQSMAGGGRRWSVADAITVVASLSIAAMLFFPAIANSRFQSQMTGCQHRLVQIGQSLTNYSEHKAGYFPEIPLDGNRSVAGIYAPTLMDEGYILDQSVFICPSSRLAHAPGTWRVPTLSDVDSASGLELLAMQRSMGGSYGYSLGYLRDGYYGALRNDGRSHFALMSDSPSLHLRDHQSSNHGGLGQNVLFEDNRVQFISSHENDRFNDIIFLNREGYTAPGVDRNDSVIGQSSISPRLMLEIRYSKG